MYSIAVLTKEEQEGRIYRKYILDYCTEKGIFPLVELYQSQEKFFEQTRNRVPDLVFLTLPGVAGLNAASIFAPCILAAGSYGAVILIFPFMLSGCVLNIFLWNLQMHQRFGRGFLHGLRTK